MDSEIMQIVKSNIWRIQIAVLITSIVLIVLSIMAWYGHGVRLVEPQKNKERIRKYEKVVAVVMIILAIYNPIDITRDNINFNVKKTVQTVVRKESAGVYNYMYSYAILENHERLAAWKLIGNISIGEKYEIYYGENSKVIFYFKDVE